jgi:hypothetical protein
MGERMGIGAGLRRALFMRSLRKAQEEPPDNVAPRINRRMRYMLRRMLHKPDQAWPLATLSSMALISQSRLYDLGVAFSTVGLAEVVWTDGKRCMRLTDLGAQDLPGILTLYRSQLLIAILLREGPRSAAYAWLTRHRDRVWRRAIKREQDSPESNAHETDVLS